MKELSLDDKASIAYLPHCSKCGSIINDDVWYEKEEIPDYDMYSSIRMSIQPFMIIHPGSCRKCGAIFTNFEFKPPREV